MKPVFQDKLHSETVNGNCLRAAIASILEIDINSIPQFEEMVDNPNWFLEFRKWSKQSGYGTVNVYHCSIPPEGYSIATGQSPRGIYHATVALDGEVVFDPHPSGDGLVEIDRYWKFEAETYE